MTATILATRDPIDAVNIYGIRRTPATSGVTPSIAWKRWGSVMTTILKGTPTKKLVLYSKMYQPQIKAKKISRTLQKHSHPGAVEEKVPREDGFLFANVAADEPLPCNKQDPRTSREY